LEQAHYIIGALWRKIMLFKYDPNKLKEYRKKGIFSALLTLCFGLPVLSILYITMSMQDIENVFLIIFMTFIMMVFAGGLGIFIGYKKAKKEYESFQIECNDTMIVISSKIFHKNIRIEQIKKILKDNKNNIYIVTNKINKTKILSFIENNEEFEKYLSSILPIEQYNDRYNILQYLPVVFLIALMYISGIGSLQLYLIFAIIVLLTTLFSSVKLIIDQMKIKYKIMGLIVYGYILLQVIIGIYDTIKYLNIIE
jgi:hypothetical protein